MKSTLLLLFLTALSLLSFGQEISLSAEDYNNSGAMKLKFGAELSQVQEFAQQDIEKGIAFLLIQSGYAPEVYSTDKLFEATFGVFYYEQGCVAPDSEMMQTYNIEVFEYLDRVYGKKWRRSIRRDVIGFKEWKKKN